MSGTLTDKLHDWASGFVGVDTRAGAPSVAPGQPGNSVPPPPSAPPASPSATAPAGSGTDPAMPAQTPPAPAPAPAAPAATTPSITVVPVPFNADYVMDFLAKGNAHFKGKSLGATKGNIPAPTWATDESGKLTKLDFALEITVSYATFGEGAPDANNEKAIRDVAARTKAHEERHQSDIEAAWKAWDPAKVRSDLMAKTFKTAKEVTAAISAETAKATKAFKDACLKLHGKEGLVNVTQQPDGTFAVTNAPEGASGCG